jgi:hypothetical protein
LRYVAAVAFAVIILLSTAMPASAWTPWRSGEANWPAEHSLKVRLDRLFLSVCGRKLRSDLRLIEIARARAQDMAVHRWLGHRIPPDGHYVSREVRAAGIRPRRVGEIGHYNYLNVPSSAAFAYRSFYRSRVHRMVMSNCSYRSVGVGTFRHGGWRMYVVVYVR